MLSLPFPGAVNDRLLPVSIPFRFFSAAAGFHVLAWLFLIFAARDLPGYSGGPGLVLVSIHLLTLGVLAMAGIGASYQLLPVATRQPLARTWPARFSFWLCFIGLLLMSIGMEGTFTAVLHTGGGLVSAGLLLFAVLTFDNLRRASGMPNVTAHGWAAMAALLGVIALGVLLIGDFEFGYLGNHQDLAIIHMVLAIFGFMGLLVLGFSQILIPMFILSRSLPPRPGWVQLGLSLAALITFVVGTFVDKIALFVLSGLLALGAVSAYFWLMRAAFKMSMRKRLGLSFLLIRTSWAFLALGILIGVAVLVELPVPNGGALFGIVILVGWLLTFLMGILQRIMPFLASMHAVGTGGKPVLLSELTAEGPLKAHAVGHFLALALCGAGILFDSAILVRLGAVSGFLGAVSFAVFAAIVVVRLRNSMPAKAA